MSTPFDANLLGLPWPPKRAPSMQRLERDRDRVGSSILPSPLTGSRHAPSCFGGHHEASSRMKAVHRLSIPPRRMPRRCVHSREKKGRTASGRETATAHAWLVPTASFRRLDALRCTCRVRKRVTARYRKEIAPYCNLLCFERSHSSTRCWSASSHSASSFLPAGDEAPTVPRVYARKMKAPPLNRARLAHALVFPRVPPIKENFSPLAAECPCRNLQTSSCLSSCRCRTHSHRGVGSLTLLATVPDSPCLEGRTVLQLVTTASESGASGYEFAVAHIPGCRVRAYIPFRTQTGLRCATVSSAVALTLALCDVALSLHTKTGLGGMHDSALAWCLVALSWLGQGEYESESAARALIAHIMKPESRLR
ncbi:hypothetical protein C8R46DRAFT_1299942 [Mycena filopes]|nr:hypothetical protein C8R46DRAFT_1299942 [Mycena filopes]